jgi:NADPH-dependent ferric siderophore reductase
MPRNIRENIIHPITLRELEVCRVVEITPGMRRVTLTGAQLGPFMSNGFAQPEFRSSGFDDDLRLVFPYPGDDAPVLPIQKDGNIESPKDRRPLAKSYTVRRWDPDAQEVDVDFVRHGTGVATTWALRCRAGDRVHAAGPARSALMPVGLDWLLIVGDETALPAIGRLLESAPAGLRAQVLIEVAEAAHEQDLKTEADATITWLHRNGAAPGTTTLLADAVRSAEWWPGEVFAWVAGETMSIKPIRRFLKEERQLPKENIEVTGYWRRGEVVTLAEDPAVPDSNQIDEPFEVLHEMGEMLPPFALRAAVTLGLPELIARGVSEVTALADAVGADQVAVGKLLRYLHALGVVAQTAPRHYELTGIGELLTQEFVIDALDLNGALGRQDLGFYGLLDSVRTGRSSYAAVAGKGYADFRAGDEFEASYQEQIGKYARFLAPALAADKAVAGAGHVVVHSDGAGVIAEAIAAASPENRVSIVGLPSKIAYLRSDLQASIAVDAVRSRISLVEQSVFERSPAADAVLFVRALDEHPDPDAVRALTQAAAGLDAGGRILVAEYPLDEESLDDHAAEEDLKNLVLYGTGHRTDAENRALFDAAGLRLDAARAVGWGFTLYVLSPV